MSAKLLDKAMNRLVLDHPFYACVAMLSPMVELDNAGMTALAGFPTYGATDGVTIYINNEKFNTLALPAAVGLLQHEVEHIARMHAFRRNHRDPSDWNEACDHVINLSILEHGGKLPDGGLHDSKYADLTEEQVYADLQKNPRQKKPGSGAGGDGDLDVLLPAPPGASKEDQAKVKEIVTTAANIAKAKGNTPGHISHLLGELAAPSKDWAQEMEEFIQDTCTADYTWRRPNRMHVCSGVYLPGLHSEDSMGVIVAIFDTSDSVSNDELRVYFGDLCAIVSAVKPSAVYVVYVDSQVSCVKKFDSPAEAEVRDAARREGGGGTDMRIGLDWVDDNVDEVAACIVFTDGDTPFGNPREYPVLWAISGHATAPWGRTLTLPSTVTQ